MREGEDSPPDHPASIQDEFARIVGTVEALVDMSGWRLGGAELAEMVLAVSSLVWDREQDGEPPPATAEIARLMKDIHDRHSRKGG
jgi:hypothetical protein